MFVINVTDKPVIFSKFFNETDAEAVRKELEKYDINNILFVDTPATAFLVDLFAYLRDEGVAVTVIDHHDTAGDSPREQEIHSSVERVKGLLGIEAYYSTREEHPSCSTLISVGQYSYYDAVVADPDPDGLTAAIKALGVSYKEIDEDSAILDGPRTARNGMTPWGMLLNRAMSCIPAFDPARPDQSETAKAKLFQTFADAVKGGDKDDKAFWNLVTLTRAGQEDIDRQKAAAEDIAKSAVNLARSVVMVDVTGETRRFDLSALMSRIENGNRLTVLKKSVGPIATIHGTQYTVAVVKGAGINLQSILDEGVVSSPENGIISNVPYLLHLSQENWDKYSERILAL